MTSLFELRPRKDLMDASFEGYKLSLDPLPVYQHELPVAVKHLQPSDDQYSFQHVKLFGLHNHLVDDPWYPEFFYYISEDLKVFRVHLHSLASQSAEFHPVWKIPLEEGNINNGFFNASLSFAGPNLAVASDGGGMLYILDTSQRDTTPPQNWELKSSSQVFDGKRPFKVLHTYLNLSEAQEMQNLAVLLLRVEPLDRVETQVALSVLGCNETETPFITCLEFLSYHFKTGHWSLNQLKRVAVPQGLDYASILNPGQSLCMIAREPLGIIYDSVKPVASTATTTDKGVDKSEPVYTWAESEDEVIVWMSFDKHTSKHDLVLEVKSQYLKVVYKKETRLEGELFHSISSESSLWTLSDGKLEIVLPKIDKSVNWNHLIAANSRGQKVPDAETAAEWHQRLIHLTSEELAGPTGGKPILSNEQLEECDDMTSDESHLFRFDGETNEFTHKAMLGGHQYLFSMPSNSSLAPSFCLRHDVDGLIWQPEGDEMMTSSWGCLHTGTLQAFGYIQASKEQRKFTVCSPNKSYVAICDAFHHVFIYRQPDSASNGVELVHRPSGRRVGTVARQQVLNLDSREECLGVLATDTFLLVLTSSSLFAVRVNSD